MGIVVMSAFPSIEPSFQFHPHSPIVSYNAPPPDVTITIENPLNTQEPTSDIVDHHGAMTTNSQHQNTITSTTAIGSTPSTETLPNNATPPSQETNPLTSNEPGSRGPKIGIIAGITIIAILVVIVAGFCIFDFRRRFRKRKQNRQRSDSELAEMSTRRSIKRNGGLWDKLKPNYIPPEADAGHQQGIQTVQSPPECRSKDEGTWKSVDIERQLSKGSRAKDQSPTTERPPEPEWLPAYMPRERGSIISTAGSLNTLGIPIMNTPVIPRTFLDVGDRK